MLPLVAALLAFSLPLDHCSRSPTRPLLPRQQQRPNRRRAPLAEHDWERHVLCNLTRSD